MDASRPPGEWQAYGIIFNVPHFGANGERVTAAYVAMIHNGVVAQNHQATRRATS